MLWLDEEIHRQKTSMRRIFRQICGVDSISATLPALRPRLPCLDVSGTVLCEIPCFLKPALSCAAPRCIKSRMPVPEA